MIGYVYLGLAIISTSFGQLLLKKNSICEKKRVFLLLLAIMLLVSVPIYIYLSLKYISFAIVFLSDALSIVLVVVISNIFLKERLNIKKILGIVLIVSGIYMLNGRIS